MIIKGYNPWTDESKYQPFEYQREFADTPELEKDNTFPYDAEYSIEN